MFQTIHWLLWIGGVSRKAASCFYWSILRLTFQPLPTISSLSGPIPQQAQKAEAGCTKQSIRFLPSYHFKLETPQCYESQCRIMLSLSTRRENVTLSRDSFSILCNKIVANVSFHSAFPPIYTETETFACC